MKKKNLALALLISGFAFAQKMPHLDYSKLDRSDMTTDLFIKSASPLSPIGKDNKHNSMYTFIQAYKELANNDELNRMPATSQLQKFTKDISFAETVKIGLLHTEYESINKQTLASNNVKIEGTSVLRTSTDYIFNKNTSTIIAPLTVNKRGLKTKFELESDFYFNNTNNQISEIKADFDNGAGFQTLSFNTPIQVNYISDGEKNLTFKILFTNGTSKTKTASFKIQQSNTEANASQMTVNEVISTETPDLSIYNGETSTKGLAEYEIFLGADNVLDKPIFIIDGFDPGDGRTTAGIYQLLSYDNNGTPENLADRIRAEEDFDVVIINHPQYFILSNGSLQSLANSTDVNTDGVIDEGDYPGSTLIDGGSDFIERNAMSTVEVINQINAQKVGDEQNVVIGPSMGGLISRYALGHMENTGQNHDTRLWLSLDSPHLGANVPIGFQHLFNYLGYGLDTPLGDQSIEAIRPIVEGMLKSGAARQMLRDQYESHLANGSTLDFDPSKLLPEAHEFGPLFYNRINNLTTSGYPETTRNVSMINGSGIGAAFKNKDGSDVTAGQQVLSVFMTVVPLIADAHLDAWATPASGSTAKISEVWIDLPWLCFCDIETDERAQAPTYSNGMDAAPGGLYDIGALAGDFGGDATIDAFFAGLTSDYFNFIPAISSMALNGGSTSNWYQNINLGAGDEPWDETTTINPNTPFVNWYIPSENEDHVALTTGNVDFAWNEIVKPSIQLSPKTYLQGASINPNVGEESLMRDNLRVTDVIPTTSPYGDAATTDISVFTTTGTDAIVDWIWVELRDATDNTSIVSAQSALLQRDGDVVAVDGVSPLSFDVSADNYFVSINHRNHLGIMNANTVALLRTATVVDFTDATNEITYGADAQSTFGLPSGKLGMWSGNVNGDNSVRYLGSGNDTSSLKDEVIYDSGNASGSNLHSFTGYNVGDVNLDGTVKYQGSENDVNALKDAILSHPDNQSSPSNLFTIEEQLPEN